jgi:hypothetical protein
MGLDIYFHKVKTTEIGYFRKVNFLVNFFESKGFKRENLVPFRVKKMYIVELIDKCQQILKANELLSEKETKELAKESLPTTDGFFFGSTDYDEYYLEDVKSVLDYCQNELLPMFDELDDDENIEFLIWY